MQLYILRHGDALSSSPDDQRVLSNYGRQQVAQIASVNRELGAQLHAIIVSPYLRAQQTAEIFSDNIGFGESLDTCPELTPDGNPVAVDRFLQQYADQTVLLVSHLPLVAELVAYFAATTPPSMGTATLASLSMVHAGPGLATLNWIKHAS